MFTCPYCSKTFNKTSGLNIHIGKSHGHESFCNQPHNHYDCTECNKQNICEDKYDFHLKYLCLLECKYCHEKYTSSQFLAHYCFKCKQCNAFIGDKSDHNCFDCTRCGSIFSTTADLDEHKCPCSLRECPFCESFVELFWYSDHIESCQKCKHCDKVFDDHTLKKNHKCFECVFCGHECLDKSELEKHKSTCKCEYCGLPKQENHDCDQAIADDMEKRKKRKMERIEASYQEIKEKKMRAIWQKKVEEVQSQSLFELLDVPSNSKFEQVKIAYRKKILLCHPDKLVSEINKSKVEFLQETFKVVQDKWNTFKKYSN